MTDAPDLEDRLTAALTRGAEQAPAADGLATASRRRARVRRRRAGVVGGVAAVLVVAATAAVVQWPRDDGPAPSTDAAEAGWRTVEVDAAGVLVDVPADWVELPEGSDCATVIEYGPPGSDPCSTGEGMTVVPEADGPVVPKLLPASEYEARGSEIDTGWSGYVGLVADGFGSVNVRSDDEQRVLHVLGSVRSPGQEAPESDAPWPLVAANGVAYRVPTDRIRFDVTVTQVPGAADEGSTGPAAGGRWRTVRGLDDVDRRIVVTAPTRALAEVIAGSARGAEGAPVGLTTLTVRDVDVDVPGDWDRLDTSGCEFDGTAFGPPGTDPCGVPYPLAIYGSSTFDPADGPGLAPTEAGWGGYVLSGDAAVTVAVADRDVARRILASVRPIGERAPEVESWTTRALTGGVTVEVPADRRVEVTEGPGVPDCVREMSQAERRPDGRWVAGLCRDRFVSVVAPTQALADVVASTVRGY